MNRYAPGASVCVAVLAFIAHPSGAQVLYTLESPNAQPGGHFGWSVSRAGDADGDGYGDLVLGARNEDGGVYDAGRAYVLSGSTASLLHTLDSPNPAASGHFGFAVSGAGDVNNDGYDDVVVGAYLEDGGQSEAGRAYIFNGQTGNLLHALESPNGEASGMFGCSVSAAGDVDNDGCDDVVVGAWHEDGGALEAGRAYIFGGQTGDLLRTLQSPDAEDSGLFGRCVSGIGDANNDGYADVVVGALCEDGGATDAGRAYVFSGQTGAVLHVLESPGLEAYGDFGCSVSGAGDADNDGCSDIAVGAFLEDGGATNAGRVYVFSGQTGSLIHVLQSTDPEVGGEFGGSVSCAGDVNGDGCDDVVVGAHGESSLAGRAHVFSGQTGVLLHTFQSPNPENLGHFGFSVSGIGDVNGAGYDDLLVGAWGEDGGASQGGRAYVFAPMDVPIELASFSAEPEAGGAQLTWLTLSETDNFGFNLGRAPLETGPFARVNEVLIPGAGTTSTPHTYGYLDETVQPGTIYWYRLEDVSLSGDRSFHGPIEVFVPGPTELGLEVLGGRDPSFLLSLAAPGRASLDLYDLVGRWVATLWKGEVPGAGTTVVRMDAHRTIAPGLYTAVLSQNNATVSRRIAIVR
jgi:hypothetical protein